MPMVSEEICVSKEQEEKVPLALGKSLSSNQPVLPIKVGPKVKRLSKFEHWIVGGVSKTFNSVFPTQPERNTTEITEITYWKSPESPLKDKILTSSPKSK